MRFGFIGAGNMASAIIRGMTIGTKSYVGEDIFVTSKSGASAEQLAGLCGATAVATAAELIALSDVLVLAVKPHILSDILPTLKEELAARQPLVISIAAGKTLAYLAEQLPAGTPIIRIMPNINAKIGAATSGLCANALVTTEQKAIAKELFSTIGTVIELEENQFGIFTVLAGSAPAFAYLYMDALARAAVKAGMSKKQALEIAAATVAGSARMVLESDEHPMELVDQVCSPGGTTIEGVAALQANGFETALMAAFDAVLEKDRRM